MKRILLAVYFIFYYQAAFSQEEVILDRHLSLHFENVALIDVIATIAEITETDFAYRTDLIPSEELVTIDIVNTPLEKTLTEVFSNYNINFRLLNGQMVLYKAKGAETIYKEEKKLPVVEEEPTVEEEPIVEEDKDDKPKLRINKPNFSLTAMPVSELFFKTKFDALNGAFQFESQRSQASLGGLVQLNVNYDKYTIGLGTQISTFEISEQIYETYEKEFVQTTSKDVIVYDTVTSYMEEREEGNVTVYIIDTLETKEEITTTTITEEKRSLESRKTTFSYLFIPLSLSREISSFGKFSIDAALTLNLYALISQKEKYGLSSGLTSEALRISTFGFNYRLGLNIYYQLWKRSQIVLSAGYYNSYTVKNSHSTFASSQAALSVGMGLRFFLAKK